VSQDLSGLEHGVQTCITEQLCSLRRESRVRTEIPLQFTGHSLLYAGRLKALTAS